MIEVVTREQWGARKVSGIKAIGKVKDIFIHHTVSPVGKDPKADVREFQRFHMDSRGYSDIGYTLLVHPDGTILHGRVVGDKAGQGAHTLNHNSTGIGISVIGNYEENQVSDALIGHINRAIQYAKDVGWVTDNPTIRPHSAVFATACCGKFLKARLGELGGAVSSGSNSQSSAAPSSSGGAPAFPGLLKKGSKGQSVRLMQQKLKDRGWKITVDGDYGEQTLKIVKAFQADKGLTVDGIVGPQTLNAIFNSPVT